MIAVTVPTYFNLTFPSSYYTPIQNLTHGLCSFPNANTSVDNLNHTNGVQYPCFNVSNDETRNFEVFMDSEMGVEEGPTLLQQMEDVATFQASMDLVAWLLPLVVGVGVAGNMVSLWVLLRRGMRRTSACRYLACLAVADTAVLLASALKTWVRVVWGAELLHTSAIACKFFIFLTHLSLTVSAWLIVAVTLERFLAVWLPLRATEVCSVRRTRGVIAALVLTLGLVNAHVFWTAELLEVSPRYSLSPSGVQCASYAHRNLVCSVFPWVHLALYCFLPAGLLLVLNSLILVKLFQHRQALRASQMLTRSSSTSTQKLKHQYHSHQYQRQRRPVSTSHCKGQLQQRSASVHSETQYHPTHQFHRRLAPMLLGVSFSWLLLTTPQTIYSLAAGVPTSLESLGLQHLVRTICFVLVYMNHALHFLLYCVTGQRFRQELRRAVMCGNKSRQAPIKRMFLNRCVINKKAPTSGNGDKTGNIDQHHVDRSAQDKGYLLMERKSASRKSPPISS